MEEEGIAKRKKEERNWTLERTYITLRKTQKENGRMEGKKILGWMNLAY